MNRRTRGNLLEYLACGIIESRSHGRPCASWGPRNAGGLTLSTSKDLSTRDAGAVSLSAMGGCCH